MRRLVVLGALAASGCERRGTPPSDQGLADRIVERVEAGAVVDLAALAPFEWDRLHVFGPYTTEEAAEQRMGVAWPDRWQWSEVQWQDDRVFLVFVHDGVIVSAFDHSRGDGDFVAPSAPIGSLGPEAARFVVRDRGDGFSMLIPEAAMQPEGEE